MGAPLTGWRNLGAGIHLVLGGLGSAGASLLMAWGGFQAGAALLTTDAGGGGQNVGDVHANILKPIVGPIARLMGIAPLRYLVGGVVLPTPLSAAPEREIPGSRPGRGRLPG